MHISVNFYNKFTIMRMKIKYRTQTAKPYASLHYSECVPNICVLIVYTKFINLTANKREMTQ